MIKFNNPINYYLLLSEPFKSTAKRATQINVDIDNAYWRLVEVSTKGHANSVMSVLRRTTSETKEAHSDLVMRRLKEETLRITEMKNDEPLNS